MIERLTIVRESIESGFYPSTALLRKTVMDKLGTDVSLPTLYRDLSFLRDRCGLDIEYDFYRHGYYIKAADSEQEEMNMKNKKKYSFNVGANYNAKTDEWNISLGVNIDLEQEDTNRALETSEEDYRLEDNTN